MGHTSKTDVWSFKRASHEKGFALKFCRNLTVIEPLLLQPILSSKSNRNWVLCLHNSRSRQKDESEVI